MLKIENKTAQAAIELAVFGAIIIFILGTIVRSGLGNAYAQNQSFNAMRMAMLASWRGTEQNLGKGALANTTHNNASILVVEDRLSPDFNKYGDLDRNPYIASGTGTFTFNLLYPWQPGVDDPKNLVPIMDIWINGLHFPFTTAAYFQGVTIPRPNCPLVPFSATYPLSLGQCLQNQCLRNAREWAGGTVTADQFDNIMQVSMANLNDATLALYGQAIFHALVIGGEVGTSSGSDTVSTGYVPSSFSGMPSAFSITDPTVPPPAAPVQISLTQQEINSIQTILQGDANAYKLFYTRIVNGTTQFVPYSPLNPPPGNCSGPDNALCSTLTLTDAFGAPHTNSDGDMQYDLLRNGDYANPLNPSDQAAVETKLGGTTNPANEPMRGYVAWQWAASAGTDASSIGLDTSSNQYPTYDIDGRLKEVTVYGISQNPNGTPSVTYEDFQGGDIDATWDRNTCAPKPGLQNDSTVFTFTMQGTYLEIKEGNLYDPETDQFVRSANKRDTIDLIQRTVQLSNNTGRFCTPPTACPDGTFCQANGQCQSSTTANPVLCSYSPPQVQPPFTACPGGSGSCQINGQCSLNPGLTCDPNPVEVCIGLGAADNCFASANISQTCYDENDNKIFVRSRLLNQGGRYWMTDTSGQLLVQ